MRMVPAMTFIHRAENGTETDVTADIGCLFDLVIGSMDWGSGFLTVEDAEPVVRIAHMGGFKEWERAQAYLDDQTQCEEQGKYLREHPMANALIFPKRPLAALLFTGVSYPSLLDPGERVPHEHVFSSVGRCMWRWCPERKP